MMRYKSWLLWLVCVLAPCVWALDGYQYTFAQPHLQQRYQHLLQVLRCPTCANQTIADSNSQVSAALRRKVYELIDQGYDDDQVLAYMVQRYGDDIVYRPALSLRTLGLWGLPLVLLLLGGGAVVWVIRRSAAIAAVDDSIQDEH